MSKGDIKTCDCCGLYPEVYKVIGAPGTGKTTRVVGNPELELKGLFLENMPEYSLDEQMLVTFTNAGVDEAADRLEKMLDEPRYRIEERVTTIHSRCFQLLGLDRDNVVGHWDKKNFCDAHDLDYGWSDDDDDAMSVDDRPGNHLMDMYEWLQNNRLNNSDWREMPTSSEWDGEGDPELLMDQWDEWKDEKGLIGFGDMIEDVLDLGRQQLNNLGWGVLFPDEDTTHKEIFEKARHDSNRKPEVIRGKGAFIDTEVLYVDEVQDLNPLQWEWYLLQKLVCEKVYIGGDDDQTIYGWSGANPEFMLNEEGDFEVLEKTYRIPSTIWETCDGVIKQVDVRQEKEVEPHGIGGDVQYLERPSPQQIFKHIMDRDQDVFVLFRARYQIDEFRDDLHSHGIPYRNMSTHDTWSDYVVNIRDALADLRDWRILDGDQVQDLVEYAPEGAVIPKNGWGATEKAMGNFHGIEPDRVNKMFTFDMSGPQAWKKYLGYRPKRGDYVEYDNDNLNFYESHAIRGNLHNDRTELMPDRIRIGTIHSAKGKEANVVVLALDTTMTIAENMAQDTRENPDKFISDAERRVYYVGMTRASEKLVLAEGVIDPQMTLRLNNLLEHYDREYATVGQENISERDW